MRQVISTFTGIAPRFAPGVKKGGAQIAENVNLSDGKIGPCAGHQVVGTGSGDSLSYYNGAFISGSGRFFCPWVMDGTEVLFSLENGVAKTVGSVTADLGQAIPGAPVTQPGLFINICDDATLFLSRRVSTDPEYVVTLWDDVELIYRAAAFVAAEIWSVVVDGVEYTEGVVGSLAPGQYGVTEKTYPSDPAESVYLFFNFITDPSVTVDCDLTPSDHFTTISYGGGTGVVSGNVVHAITTHRNVGGFEDESGLGAVSASLAVTNNSIRVNQPSITDPLVTHWSVYRLSADSGEFQFCAKIAVGTSYYDDNLLVSELGATPLTYYTSDQGNDILFSKPVTFDGLSGPHAGMLFGWKDATLFWSEPGSPDGWPAYYSMNFPSHIKAVAPFAGALAVICETGPFRIDGTHPELLQQNKGIGAEPCLSSGCVETGKGVVYMSDSGIVMFNLYESVVITDALFGEGFFSDWDKGSVFFAENDGKIFAFHSGGCLVFDAPTGAWTSLDLVATAAFKRASDGELYVVSGGEILKVFGGGALIYTFRSGDIFGDGGDDTEFKGVTVVGSGDVTLSLYVDGSLKASRALDFTMDRGKTVMLRQEHAGRALWFELSGTGRVTEVIVS